MLSAEEEERLQKVFEEHEYVEAVYLFGSVAEGRARGNSDLDLGIVTSDGKLGRRKLDLLSDLVRNGFDDIDLVDLNVADPVTRHEAVRLNQLIYSTTGFSRGEYYSRTVRMYLDLKPYLDRQRKAYKERILDGSS